MGGVEGRAVALRSEQVSKLSVVNGASGVALADPVQEELRRVLKERGGDHVAVGDALGIGRLSVLRAASGLPVKRGTAKAIELGLPGLKGGA